MAGRALVVGASGDVGLGIAAVLIERGWTVVASGRDPARLAVVTETVGPSGRLVLLPGSVSSDADAARLVAAAGPIDAAVVTVNASVAQTPLRDQSPDGLLALLHSNLVTHFIAARAILPALPDHGVLVGIGGGMADFILPRLGHVAIAQAGLRNFYRAFAAEWPGPQQVRELLIASMVNGRSKRATADPRWLTDRDIGEHVAAILADPSGFPDTVITLRSRKQVGLPPEPARA